MGEFSLTPRFCAHVPCENLLLADSPFLQVRSHRYLVVPWKALTNSNQDVGSGTDSGCFMFLLMYIIFLFECLCIWLLILDSA